MPRPMALLIGNLTNVPMTTIQQVRVKMAVVMGWPGVRKSGEAEGGGGVGVAGGAEVGGGGHSPAEDEEGQAGQSEEDEVDGDDVAEDLFVGAGEGDDDGDDALQCDGEDGDAGFGVDFGDGA